MEVPARHRPLVLIEIRRTSYRDSDGDGLGAACDPDCPDLDGRTPVCLRDFAVLATSWRSPSLNTGVGDLHTDGRALLHRHDETPDVGWSADSIVNPQRTTE